MGSRRCVNGKCTAPLTLAYLRNPFISTLMQVERWLEREEFCEARHQRLESLFLPRPQLLHGHERAMLVLAASDAGVKHLERRFPESIRSTRRRSSPGSIRRHDDGAVETDHVPEAELLDELVELDVAEAAVRRIRSTNTVVADPAASATSRVDARSAPRETPGGTRWRRAADERRSAARSAASRRERTRGRAWPAFICDFHPMSHQRSRSVAAW